jgi:hypothetical protein
MRIMEGMKTSSQLLLAASHALRSYQYGNSATELAKEVADEVDAFLVSNLNQQQTAAPQPAAAQKKAAVKQASKKK